jgi:hypothetical protein
MHNKDPQRDSVYHKAKANVAKGSLREKLAAVLLFVTDCIQFLWLIYHLLEFTTKHLYGNTMQILGYMRPLCVTDLLQISENLTRYLCT